jgi:hypothetical protein
MKAHEAVIAWTPANWCSKTRGRVAVGRLIYNDRGWTAPYACAGGAAYPPRRDLRGAESLVRVFIDFHNLVVHHGISPQAAHDAFMIIDEFFDAVSGNILGEPGWHE